MLSLIFSLALNSATSGSFFSWLTLTRGLAGVTSTKFNLLGCSGAGVGSLSLLRFLIRLLGSLFRAKLIILPAGRRVGEKESWLVIVAEEPGEFLLLKFGKFSKGLVFLLPPRVLLAEGGGRRSVM